MEDLTILPGRRTAILDPYMKVMPCPTGGYYALISYFVLSAGPGSPLIRKSIIELVGSIAEADAYAVRIEAAPDFECYV